MSLLTKAGGCLIGVLLLALSNGVSAGSGEPTELWWDEMRGLNYETGAASELLQSLDGSDVMIPGWAVPLDSDMPMTIKEFVLVPGFGMCIHVPPPPPNQMVYVVLPEAVHFQDLLGPLWIKGKIEIRETESRYGAASYTMVARDVEPYKQSR